MYYGSTKSPPNVPPLVLSFRWLPGVVLMLVVCMLIRLRGRVTMSTICMYVCMYMLGSCIGYKHICMYSLVYVCILGMYISSCIRVSMYVTALRTCMYRAMCLYVCMSSCSTCIYMYVCLTVLRVSICMYVYNSLPMSLYSASYYHICHDEQ